MEIMQLRRDLFWEMTHLTVVGEKLHGSLSERWIVMISYRISSKTPNLKTKVVRLEGGLQPQRKRFQGAFWSQSGNQSLMSLVSWSLSTEKGKRNSVLGEIERVLMPRNQCFPTTEKTKQNQVKQKFAPPLFCFCFVSWCFIWDIFSSSLSFLAGLLLIYYCF